MNSGFPVRLLNYFFSVNERNKCIAHCLNFDLVTSADTMKEAEQRLDLLVRYHIGSYMSTNGASGINAPAPREFWNQYTDALRGGRILPSSTLQITLPELSPIQEEEEFEILAARAA